MKVFMISILMSLSISSFAMCELDAKNAASEYLAEVMNVEETSIQLALMDSTFNETYGKGSYFYDSLITGEDGFSEEGLSIEVVVEVYSSTDDSDFECVVDDILED